MSGNTAGNHGHDGFSANTFTSGTLRGNSASGNGSHDSF
jgi:hypothetical protein